MKRFDKKTGTVILILIILPFLLFLASGSREAVLEDLEILKNEPGAGTGTSNMEVTLGDIVIEDFSVTVKEREKTKEEIEEEFIKARTKIIKKLLGDNKDLTNITKDLCFFTSIEDYPFEIEITSDSEKLSDKGKILTEKPFETVLTINLWYGDYKDVFCIKLKVNPGKEIKERLYKETLEATLLKNETKDRILLPKEVDGKAITYRSKGKKRNKTLLLLTPISIIALFIGQKKEERDKQKKRKEKILLEYPVLLTKMSLYLSSGMTIRNIWILIFEEGVEKKGKDHPLYQEMGVALNEIQSGISEAMAYKRFGERTNVPELVRFSALLSQNLKKGSSKLNSLLEEELSKAFFQRKNEAIKKGEEAGTRLLAPMMLLLITVLLIIVVPAFVNI